MRLRQVALVARNLEAVVDDLTAILGIEVGFHDPGVGTFGLRNAVMPVGDTFLEVVSPDAPGSAAERFLDRRGGDGGYMVIVQTDDLDADRRRLDGLGVRIVWEIAFPDIATIHLHPRDIGGAILSLDVADPPASWRWAGPEWKSKSRTDVTTTIVGVELSALEPAPMAARWGEVLDRACTVGGDGSWEIPLDQGTLRFVVTTDARAIGVTGLDVAVVARAPVIAAARARGCHVDGDTIAIGGIRVRLL